MDGRSSTQNDNYTTYWGPKRFSGHIRSKEDATRQVQCSVVVSIRDDGSISLKFDDLPFDESSAFLVDAAFATKEFTKFSLEVSSDDDDLLSTDDLYFMVPVPSRTARGLCYSLSGECGSAALITKSERDSHADCIVFRLRGFRTNDVELNVPTPFGDLIVFGPTSKDDEYSKIDGYFCMKMSSVAGTADAHRQQAVEFLEHVLYIMSLARGTLVSDPVREIHLAGRKEFHIRRVIIPSQSFLAPFYDHDFLTMLECAISIYSEKQKECTELRSVISRVLMPTTYVEVRLINVCAAIEYLTERYLSEDEKRRLDADRFANIRDTLSAILNTSTLVKKDRDFVTTTVERSNWVQLEVKIKRLLTKLGISLEEIPDDAIKNMIDARNVIVHGGMLHEDKRTKDLDAWNALLLAHELITRIILSRMGYSGYYLSYPGGQRIRDFPSCKRK